jgi:hypothetical protein
MLRKCANLLDEDSRVLAKRGFALRERGFALRERGFALRERAAMLRAPVHAPPKPTSWLSPLDSPTQQPELSVPRHKLPRVLVPSESIACLLWSGAWVREAERSDPRAGGMGSRSWEQWS